MQLVPQPAGEIVWFGFWSVQLARGAVQIWRRTGLPFLTAAMVQGAVMSLCLAVLAAIGRPFQEMSAESWVLFAGTAVSALLLNHIESRVNKSKVKQCAEYMEHKNVWDILTGRHIPHLRNGGN
jgi:hypothetical protein